MNIKIILILFFAILFSPEVSLAMIVPSANLTVIVNTQTDASFYFHLTGTQDFDLQTQNLSASKTISILAPSGSYVLSQDNVAGLKISNKNGVSHHFQPILFIIQLTHATSNPHRCRRRNISYFK